MSLFRYAIIAVAFALFGCNSETKEPMSASYKGPVIDMHLHAMTADAQGPPPLGVCFGDTAGPAHDPREPWGAEMVARAKAPPCEEPIWSAESDEALRDETLAELERLNVIGVLSGPRERVAAWKDLAPDRIIAGHQLSIGRETYTPDDIAEYFDAGGFEVLAEVANQYAGIAPDDERFDAYWRMAAESDIPVGIHIGVGPPGAPYLSPGFRARLHSPLALEEILIRHPTLRVYVMHAGWPMLDEMKAMLYTHPQLYVGTGVLQMALTRAEYYAFLEELTRAGFTERILFGSDQMVWPGLIEAGIDAINEAPFLTADQKAAILHDNAARFLRLNEE